MKHLLPAIIIIITLSLPLAGFSQTAPGESETIKKEKREPRFGIKAGYAINKIAENKTSFDPAGKSGFMASAFFSPVTKNGLGYRSEIVFSRMAHTLVDGDASNKVTTDYIYLPQLTTFTIAKVVQLQAGGQVGFLVKAAGKKTNDGSSSNGIMDFMNRIDYGFAGGIEIYPVKRLIIGSRYNISLGNMYKKMEEGDISPLPFFPTDIKSKNAVIQFFAGFRF